MDFGHLGCMTDVTDIVDRRCSGKQRCDIPMPNEEIKATNPCVQGLYVYLEASYTCIPGKCTWECRSLSETAFVTGFLWH